MKNLDRLALLALLVAGCATSQVEPDARLPFHVALKPVAVSERGDYQRRPGPESKPEQALRFDRQSTSRAIHDTLAQGCFARVTLLPYPQEAQPANEEATDPMELDRYWIQAAREAGADLLLECSFDYRPEYTSETNDRFLPNIVLFLVGGPASYLVQDRTYRARAELLGEFYELNALSRAKEPNYRDTKLITVQAGFSEAALNFLDRADGFSSYAASIIMPVGLLDSENEKVRDSLEESIVGAVASGFRDRVIDKQRELIVADRTQPFWFELEEGGLQWVGPNKVAVRGLAFLQTARGRDRMAAYRLYSGSLKGEWGFDQPGQGVEPPLPDDLLRFPVSAIMEVDPDADVLRMELEEASGDRLVRSYTFSLEGIARASGAD